jgi:Domain of unknown function (DUF1707)
MPAPYNPPWGRGSSGQRSTPDPNIRVSHAERTEVADRLSKHYGDGRLDEEEFNERLDQAMKAKTRADLNGLFDDLPDSEAPSRQQAAPPAPPMVRPPRRHSQLPRIVFLAFVAIVAIMVGQALAGPLFAFPLHVGGWPWGWGFHIPWLLIGLVVFLWYRFARRRP